MIAVLALACMVAGCGDSSSSSGAPPSLRAAASRAVDARWRELLDDTDVQPTEVDETIDPSEFDFLILDARDVSGADSGKGMPKHEAVRAFLAARKGVLVLDVGSEESELLASLVPVLESSMAPHVFVAGEWIDEQLANHIISYPETAVVAEEDSVADDGDDFDGTPDPEEGFARVITVSQESEQADRRFAARIQEYVRREKLGAPPEPIAAPASVGEVLPQVPPPLADRSDEVIYSLNTFEQEIVGSWLVVFMIQPEAAGRQFSGTPFTPRFSTTTGFSATGFHRVWTFLDSTRRSNLLTNTVVVTSEWRANPNEAGVPFGTSAWQSGNRWPERQRRGNLPIWWAGREQARSRWYWFVEVSDAVQTRVGASIRPATPRGWTLESRSPSTQNNTFSVETTERHSRVRSRGWAVSGSPEGPGISFEDGTRDSYEFISSRSTTMPGWGVRENGRNLEREARWTFLSQAPLDADAPALPRPDLRSGLNDLNLFRSAFATAARWSYQNPNGPPSYARGRQVFVSSLRATLFAQYSGLDRPNAILPPWEVTMPLQLEVESDKRITIDFDSLVTRMIENARARGAYRP